MFLILLGLTHQQVYGSFYAPGNASESKVVYPPDGWSASHVSLIVGVGAGAALGGLVAAGLGLLGYARHPG